MSVENRAVVPKVRAYLRVALVSWLVATIVGAGCLTFTVRTARESERKWCGVVNTLHEGYQAAPTQPITDRAAKLRDDIARLRIALGCDRR